MDVTDIFLVSGAILASAKGATALMSALSSLCWRTNEKITHGLVDDVCLSTCYIARCSR